LFLILFFSSKVFAQSDSIGFKTIAFEPGVTSYQIQSATDTNKTWSTITTIQPQKNKDSNIYAYPITTANIYYRIKAQMVGNIYYSPAMFYAPQSPNSATISKTKISTSWWTDKLTWTTNNESNVAYYLIEYTSGASWRQLANIISKGDGNY